MKYFLLIFGLLLTTGLIAQNKKPVFFFLDSTEISAREFKAINPETVTLASLYKDSSAFQLIGDRAKGGEVVYIETINFAKKRFWKFFSKKSTEYRKAFPNLGDDSNAVYILNDSILKNNYFGTLAQLDESTLKSIKVIDKKELKKKFKITDKTHGVVIEAIKPE